MPLPEKKDTIFGLLRPYYSSLIGLFFLTIMSNGFNLAIPKIIANSLDKYSLGTLDLYKTIGLFLAVAGAIFVFSACQSIMQVYTSEKVAKDLRTKIIEKISFQSYEYIQSVTPAKLLTNLTSDVDSIKTFVSQAIVSIISSVFLIIGASILLLTINWRLALAVLLIIPIIGISFTFIFSKVRMLFKVIQETVDWLNKIINESILGASLVRLLNSQTFEYQKFLLANSKAKETSLKILGLFATLIPIIIFTSNLAILLIVVMGGQFIISGTMTVGDFAAFNGYVAILIFPIILIGFMSGVIAQATASYGRIAEVLNAPLKPSTSNHIQMLSGSINVKDLSLQSGEKYILKNISFEVQAKSKVAIIGPTAAGKTQLLHLLMGLIPPTSGNILYDKKPLQELEKSSFHEQVGMVFQDSALFNLTLRENIAFSNIVKDEDIAKAIDTAELRDFVESLPQKLDTIVSERGMSLSGGQKQRIMLARALALNPKILFLDDFTARLDINTEKKVLENIQKNYPDLTLLNVTQKIEPIKEYDLVILLMEGEILAMGTHEELIKESLEYIQILNSQLSTNDYELQTE